MKKMVGLVLVLALKSFSSNARMEQYNHMTKLLHHKGQLSDKIVCCFERNPIWNRVPHLADKDEATPTSVKLYFFFPHAVYSGTDIKAIVDQINQLDKQYYKIAFEQVEKPLRGLQVAINYNPEKIGFEYEQFNAISNNDKGIVFHFHNKMMLKELNEKTDGIMHYAYNQKKPCVMIDCGHGGQDEGKVGFFGVKEKDINLRIGFRVAELLKKKGYHVYLTRKSDIFVPLDQRTTSANYLQADLFLSIHANASLKADVSGIETYWTPKTLFKKEVAVNDPVTQKILMRTDSVKDEASKLFAHCLHEKVLTRAKQYYEVVNRKIRTSVAQVLLGTEMPAALIEVGFLSNKYETLLLKNDTYQRSLAQAICEGVESYFQQQKVA